MSALTVARRLRTFAEIRSATECVIVDIDGTLANIAHRLHLLPTLRTDGDYQPSGPTWADFHAAAVDDAPFIEMVALSNALARDYPIILCTGRGEETRNQTTAWLTKHGVRFDQLRMRPVGDHRKDTVLKAEMLEAIKAEGFEPMLAVEDRSSVVAVWRAAGIRCLQVCEGDY